MAGLGDADIDSPIDIALDDDVARDPSKDAVRVELPDGSITINLGPVRRATGDSKHDDNLAEDMPSSDLYSVADELLLGIDEDERSRSEWLEERAEGIKLLALKIDRPGAGAEEGAGRSKVRDPLLLEAVLRFQANASGELMPVDGPVKIRDDKQDGETQQRSAMADDLETDLNHYLTAVATEYYPDTDRMLFWTGFGGSGFKKVYRCPIRRRPVSEAVDAADIIVSNSATDLANADRVTHVVKMSRATMKRMQILGAYRDVGLSPPSQESRHAVDKAKEELSGVRPSQRPDDEPFTLYECYCQIDLPGYEHEEDGEPTGLPLPYKVVIDKTSREVLEIRRNWAEDDEMQTARKRFVKFPFVPGLGFYDIGLLHIAGNPSMAATALLRVMIDAGIFGNFPGFLHAKDANRGQTSVLNVMPGTSVPVDTGGVDDIRKSIMALPYKTPDGATLSLLEKVHENGQRVAGTAELQVGEGRQDAPVGTTIALIEQATKVLDAVHKRLHRAQGEELTLLRDLFRETPDDFWRLNKSPTRAWDEATFIAAINDCDFVPAADPNTSSHVQRIMKAQAVYQMAVADPNSFDKPSVYKFIGDTIRVANFGSLLAKGPPPGPQAPPPTLADQAKMISAQADTIRAQSDAKSKDAQTGLAAADLQNKAQDRAASQQEAGLGFAKEKLAVDGRMQEINLQAAHDDRQAAADHARDRQAQDVDHAHDLRKTALGAALKPETPARGNA